MGCAIRLFEMFVKVSNWKKSATISYEDMLRRRPSTLIQWNCGSPCFQCRVKQRTVVHNYVQCTMCTKLGGLPARGKELELMLRCTERWTMAQCWWWSQWCKYLFSSQWQCIKIFILPKYQNLDEKMCNLQPNTLLIFQICVKDFRHQVFLITYEQWSA